MLKVFCFSVLKCLLCYALAQPLDGENHVDMMDRLELNLSYLIKDSELRDHFSISQDGIAIYGSKRDQQMGRPEFFLYPEEFDAYWGMMQLFPPERMMTIYENKGTSRWPKKIVERYQPFSIWKRNHSTNQVLKGVRIAVDPGHIAGSMTEAELEGKYVKVKATTERSGAAFWEANLTLATAFWVRDKLRKLGAEVLMTRKASGISAMGMDYNTWRAEHFHEDLEKEYRAGRITKREMVYWRNQASEKDIYRRLFNQLDLRARARQINAFRPHLTLIIHYNVDKENWEKRDDEGFFQPGYNNYSMAFIPGSYMKGELDTQEKRIYFLYLLISDNIQQSMQLANDFIKANEKHTGVSPVIYQDGPDYLRKYCIPTSAAGVYSRNLALNSLITSPLCYGESLCQDFWRELIWLSRPEFEIGGVIAPGRIEAVADAYVDAICNFLKK